MDESKKSWAWAQMFWSAAVAALVWSAIGFSWFDVGFGWMTSGAASEMVGKAVVDTRAEICVAQANAAPKEDIVAFKKEPTWKRRDIVKKNGWATMPGSTSPDDGVVRACAEVLENT